MKLFRMIKKIFVVFFVGIWDFLFFFFGFTYEKQAKKLNLDEMDDILRGPECEKTSHQFYKANKVTRKGKI